MEPVTEVGDEPAVRLVRRYGKYETIARIGTGGMAEVFLARQSGPMRFEKIVVLKTIHDHLSSQREFIDMLLDEARIAALLKHPHVVDIYDLGVEADTFFIAMEYVAGESMSEVIRAGRKGQRLDIFSSASIIAGCAEGLHAAHELQNLSGEHLNLVHRDVTPGNIMVLYGGDVKLVDFGVAKARGRAVETGARKLKGKLGYVSPEQLEGIELDRRSDIFSLGVVMWESLALRRLFRAESEAAVVRAILAGNVAPPSAVNPDVPAELDAICLKALSFKRDDRYQTAAEMQFEIEAFLRTANFYESQRQIASYMRRVFATRIADRKQLLQRVARADTSTGSFPIIEALENPPAGTDELSGERLIEEATNVQTVTGTPKGKGAAAAQAAAALEKVAPGKVAPGKVASGKVAPGKVAPGKVAPGKALAGLSAPAKSATGKAAAGIQPAAAPAQSAKGKVTAGRPAGPPVNQPSAPSAPASTDAASEAGAVETVPTAEQERRLPLMAPPSTGVHSFDDLIGGRTASQLDDGIDEIEIAFDAADPTGIDTQPAPIEDEPTTVDDSSVEIIEEPFEAQPGALAAATAAAETVLVGRREKAPSRKGPKIALGALLIAGLIAAFFMARRENKGKRSTAVGNQAGAVDPGAASAGTDPGTAPQGEAGAPTEALLPGDGVAGDDPAGAEVPSPAAPTEDSPTEPMPDDEGDLERDLLGEDDPLAADPVADVAGDPTVDPTAAEVPADEPATLTPPPRDRRDRPRAERPTPRPADSGPSAAELTADGQRLYISGNYDGAIAKFRAAAKRGDAAAYRGLGLVYEKLGQTAKAIAAFKSYLKKAPRASDADAIRARIVKLGG